jgi:DNA-binding beta-propeller fold protein YncE
LKQARKEAPETVILTPRTNEQVSEAEVDPALMTKALFRWSAGVLLGGAVLLAAAWLAFVPRAREAGYEFITAWGERGDRTGEFHDPSGIAVAGGQVFVADSRNGRIQVFDQNGEFLRVFGQPGEAPGELGRPMNLTVHGDELYVPEYFNDRIQVFGLDGGARRVIGEAGSGPGQFSAPGGVAVAENGDLFVADFYNHRVQQLRADGSFVQQWGTTGEIGVGVGTFNYPTDVALDAQGALYVADGYNDRVQAFTAAGCFSHKWGGPFAMNVFGPFNGWFATVTGMAIDERGNVFVSDFYNHRVQKFAADGTFLSSFGSEGSGPGEFLHPLAVATAPGGVVYVTDFGNNRVQKWRSQ